MISVLTQPYKSLFCSHNCIISPSFVTVRLYVLYVLCYCSPKGQDLHLRGRSKCDLVKTRMRMGDPFRRKVVMNDSAKRVVWAGRSKFLTWVREIFAPAFLKRDVDSTVTHVAVAIRSVSEKTGHAYATAIMKFHEY
jgi:hypothetical protein